MMQDEQPVAAPEAKVAEKPKKCKHVIVIIVLTILFAGSLAFGIVELIMNLQKKADNCETTNNKNQNVVVVKPSTDSKQNTDSDNKTNPNTNRSEDDDSLLPQPIMITVHIDIANSTILRKCSDDTCVDGAWYENTPIDSDFRVSSEGGVVTYFGARDGWFGGAAPYGYPLKESVDLEFHVDGRLKQITAFDFGNAGIRAILILREDGTMAAIYLDDEGKEFILNKKLEGIKDITTLREGANGDGGDVFAIDKNGKAHSLGEAIWNWEED